MPLWSYLNGFMSLNQQYRYQLTVLHTFAQAIVSKEIDENKFEISTDKPSTEVSWQVTGLRSDPYMKMHPWKVEEDKAPEQRGKYIDPVSYGLPEDKSINFHKLPVVENLKSPVRPEQRKSSCVANRDRKLG
jgi:hypothetical protein